MRALRFAWVGAGGFLLQLAALQGLVTLGVPYLPATAAAVEAAILHNFFWHERWTWADRGRRGHWLARLLRFNGATALVSIGGNLALMAFLAGRLHWPLLVANAVAVVSISVVNFLSADHFVFAADDASPSL